MKYKIYKMSVNRRHESEGYGIRTVLTHTFECGEYDSEYDSIQEAEDYIRANTHQFKSSTLVILPVYEIDYDGKLKDE